ncbi:MAG: hypothetical protein K940chlam5_01533 [Candidatus Anoxychlamydiales bacterium]|nr:hypothetical protein [Candidatus Anoxychlamydiales bacterium]
MAIPIPKVQFRCLNNQFHEDLRVDVKKINEEKSPCKKVKLLVLLQSKVFSSQKTCCVRPFYKDSLCIFTHNNTDEIKKYMDMLSFHQKTFSSECKKEKIKTAWRFSKMVYKIYRYCKIFI